jgi:hypothetical protein
MSWWRKEGDDFRAAVHERNRPKVGRMARLRAEVERIEASPGRLPSPADHDQLATNLNKIRAPA